MATYYHCYTQGIGDSGQGFVNALLFCVFTPKVRKQFLLLLLNSRCLRRQCLLVVQAQTSPDSHDSLSSTFPVMRSKPRKFVDNPLSQEDQPTSQNKEDLWYNVMCSSGLLLDSCPCTLYTISSSYVNFLVTIIMGKMINTKFGGLQFMSTQHLCWHCTPHQLRPQIGRLHHPLCFHTARKKQLLHESTASMWKGMSYLPHQWSAVHPPGYVHGTCNARISWSSFVQLWKKRWTVLHSQSLVLSHQHPEQWGETKKL